MESQQALPEWFLYPGCSETNSEREQRCEHLATKYPFLSYIYIIIYIYVRVPEGTVSTFFLAKKSQIVSTQVPVPV